MLGVLLCKYYSDEQGKKNPPSYFYLYSLNRVLERLDI